MSDRWAEEIASVIAEMSAENRRLQEELTAMTADMLTVQAQRNEWRECWGSVDVENGKLKCEIRRLSGALLAIAGAAPRTGGGSIGTAAYEAATRGASVDDIARKLGNPIADLEQNSIGPETVTRDG